MGITMVTVLMETAMTQIQLITLTFVWWIFQGLKDLLMCGMDFLSMSMTTKVMYIAMVWLGVITMVLKILSRVTTSFMSPCTTICILEDMPVVSRADCTQVEVAQSVAVNYDKDTTLLTASATIAKFEFNSCEGADNTNNDLAAYYQQLVNDGKATDSEKAAFDKYVVGENGCDEAIADFLDTKGPKIN